MKLYLSADIEGTTGIAHWDETEKNHPDWKYFSEQMSREVAAAASGAFDAGADEVFIKDAHDSARNIIPAMLPENENLRILRGWSGTPYSMVSGIDRGFDAVIFTGYHSAASKDTSPLSHTMNTKNNVILLNDVPASEFLLNAYTAAYYGVKPLMITGDKGVCEFAKELNPNIHTVAVNEGFGESVISIHPNVAVKKIYEEAKAAIKEWRDDRFTLRLPERFKVEISFVRHFKAFSASQYPNVKKINDTTIRFETDDFIEVMRTLKWIL